MQNINYHNKKISISMCLAFIFLFNLTSMNVIAAIKEYLDFEIGWDESRRKTEEFRGPLASLINSGGSGAFSSHCPGPFLNQCNGPLIEHQVVAAATLFDYNGITSYNSVDIILPQTAVEVSGKYRVSVLGFAEIIKSDIAYSYLVLSGTGAGFGGRFIMAGFGNETKEIWNDRPTEWTFAEQTFFKCVDNLNTFANPVAKAQAVLNFYKTINDLAKIGKIIPHMVVPFPNFQMSYEVNLVSGYAPKFPFITTAHTLVNAVGSQVQISSMDAKIYIYKVILEGPLNQTDSPLISVEKNDVVNFGDCEIGSSKTQTYTVKNVGAGILSGNIITPSGFRVVSGNGYSLASGESIQVQIAFEPTEAKPVSGNIIFTGGGDAIRRVTGNGISQSALLEIAPTGDITCRDVAVGNEISCVVKLFNMGKTALNGSVVGLTSPFSIVGADNYTVNPGDTS